MNIGLVQKDFKKKMKFSEYFVFDNTNKISYLYENKLWKEEKQEGKPGNFIVSPTFGILDFDENKMYNIQEVLYTPKLYKKYFPSTEEKFPTPFKNPGELFANIGDVNLFVVSVQSQPYLIKDNFNNFAKTKHNPIKDFDDPNNGMVAYPNGRYLEFDENLTNLGLAEKFLKCVVGSNFIHSL